MPEIDPIAPLSRVEPGRHAPRDVPVPSLGCPADTLR